MAFERVIQQNYGYCWEDIRVYPCNSMGNIWNKETKSGFLKDLKEYRQTGYATRQFFRKIVKQPVTVFINH